MRRNKSLGWLLGAGVVALGIGLFARPARADLVAVYVQGHGGMSSHDTGGVGAASDSNELSPALGVQGGVRVLVFEAYGDRTSFGSGSSVTRGILGLRGAIGLGGLRLILRGGGGVISERGGALTGRLDGAPARDGYVARAGAALESRLARGLYGGFGVDGEYYSLGNPSMPGALSARTQGTDIFASLHLKFEVGL
jgi:hypothetical protein